MVRAHVHDAAPDGKCHRTDTDPVQVPVLLLYEVVVAETYGRNTDTDTEDTCGCYKFSNNNFLLINMLC